MAETKHRGFASMDGAKQREVASKGGQAAHEKGTAHEFDSEEAREAGRKGGEAVSRNREHMSMIGRKGRVSVSRDREHMAEIGREGRESRGVNGRPGGDLGGSPDEPQDGSRAQHAGTGRQGSPQS